MAARRRNNTKPINVKFNLNDRRMTRSTSSAAAAVAGAGAGVQKNQLKNDENFHQKILLNPPIVLVKPLKTLKSHTITIQKLDFDEKSFEKSQNPQIFQQKQAPTIESPSVLDEVARDDFFDGKTELKTKTFTFNLDGQNKLTHTPDTGHDDDDDDDDLLRGDHSHDFWGCKICGLTFPLNLDHLYQRHMIISHGVELSHLEILNSKIKILTWTNCHSCSLWVDKAKFEGHAHKCENTKKISDDFCKKIQILLDTIPKLTCGICPAVQFESRLHLRDHMMWAHPEANDRVILDPFLRCGICLSNFEKEGSHELIRHVENCTVSSCVTPGRKTVEELLEKNLWCQICKRNHGKIEKTMSCYQKKSLMRCILCLHVSLSPQTFLGHLKFSHGHLQGSDGTGLCCPFCTDGGHSGPGGSGVARSVKEAFRHFIDHHLV